MAELSHYEDGHILDSLLLPCAAEAAETELRSLFHQLSSQGGDGSDLLAGPDHSEPFACWFQRVHALVKIDGEMRDDGEERTDAPNRYLPFGPALSLRIKKLVSIVVAAKKSGSEKPDNSVLKRKSDSLQNVLMILKHAAVHPCEEVGPSQELRDQILRARKVLFLREEEISISNMEEFPYRSKKRKARFCLSETSTESDMLKQPKRRSQRTLFLLKIGDSHLPRMRIPVGSSFQADVPEWNGPPISKHDSDDNVDWNDSRWLGTQVWPPKGCGAEIFEDNIGKGRGDCCYCSHPGSAECIKIHVNSARRQLKYDLDSAFNYWGFDNMGEDVSKYWTSEEQKTFDNTVKLNLLSNDRSFLEPASKFFPAKSRKDLVNYYFNVYVLRRISHQTRVSSETIDSDDEGNDNAYDLVGSYTFVRVPEVSYSISSQSRCIGWMS